MSVRPHEGQLIDIPGWGLCRVMASSDPSLVLLEIQSTGRQVRIGEQALRLYLIGATPSTETLEE